MFDFKGFFEKHPKLYTVPTVKVQLIKVEGQITSVNIVTPRLVLSSLQSGEEKQFLFKLLTHSELTPLYGSGKPYTHEQAEAAVELYSNRWQQNNPLSCFIVSLASEPYSMIGYSAIGYSKSDHTCGELSYLYGMPDEQVPTQIWNRGYASEATWAHVNSYVPELIQSDEVNMTHYFYDEAKHHPLKGVMATARADNPASVSVLLKSGLDLVNQSPPQPVRGWPGDRYSFFTSTDAIKVMKHTASGSEAAPAIEKHLFNAWSRR
jgi:RimJ/RimL family protein N-acetyltransferase